MNNEPLYQKCPACGNSDMSCQFCNNEGIVEVGVTMGKLEQMADLERALAGDPGLPAEKTRKILDGVRLKLDRLDNS